MSLAHQIGEDRCSIFAQDISQKSATFLRLKEYINPAEIISMTGVKHLSNVRYQLSAVAENPVVSKSSTQKVVSSIT